MKGVIIGFGNMGRTHLDRYLSLGVDRLVVVEPNKDKWKESGDSRFTYLDSIEDILDMEEIDFFDICTPTDMHFAQIQKLMKYDKKILVEKPVVRTRDEVHALRDERYNERIFVGEVELYNKDLRDYLNYKRFPGVINIVRKVNLDYFLENGTKNKPWFLDEERSGGIVLDLLIHDLTLIVAKYGKPKVLNAMGNRIRYDVIDEVAVSLETSLETNSIDIEIYNSWLNENYEIPIDLEIVFRDSDKNLLKFKSNDYMVKKDYSDKDPFYQELKEFLYFVETGKKNYDLNIFLDAVDVALEINELIESKK